MGVKATRRAGGEWEYPQLVVAMDAVVLHPIREYIRRQQATISKKVVYRPIYELHVEVEQMTGKIWMVRWWYQDVVNEPEE